MPYLTINEVVLINCNIGNDSYHQNLGFLYTFVPNKLFGQLLNISPKYFVFLKTFDSECSYIEVWLTDQDSNPIEIKDITSITTVITQSIANNGTLFSSTKRSNILKSLWIFVFC